MATISVRNFIDSVLPAYGNSRENIPAWDAGQKMFILDQYQSASGNRSYIGMRFCDRLAVVEKVGMFHSWTYINSLELYVYNTDNIILVQKKDFNKEFRNEELIKEESRRMVETYLLSVMKSKNVVATEEVMADVKKHASALIEECYRNFLDVDFNTALMKNLLLQIERR